MIFMNRNELYHYGVKGMKWRKHRYRVKVRIPGEKPIGSEVNKDYVEEETDKKADADFRHILDLKFDSIPKKERDKLIDDMVKKQHEKRKEKRKSKKGDS